MHALAALVFFVQISENFFYIDMKMLYSMNLLNLKYYKTACKTD